MAVREWHVDGGELLQCPDCKCLVPDGDLAEHIQQSHNGEAFQQAVKNIIRQGIKAARSAGLGGWDGR